MGAALESLGTTGSTRSQNKMAQVREDPSH